MHAGKALHARNTLVCFLALYSGIKEGVDKKGSRFLSPVNRKCSRIPVLWKEGLIDVPCMVEGRIPQSSHPVVQNPQSSMQKRFQVPVLKVIFLCLGS